MTTRPLAPPLFALLLVGTAVVGFAQTASPSRQSPFTPPPSAAVAAPLDLPNYEVIGVMSLGKDRLIAIADRQANKEHWIPIGRQVGGIEVITYEPRTQEIVARIHGELRTLRLRSQSASGVGAPAATGEPTTALVVTTPLPTPTGPAKPLTPIQEEERDARMLVSDLLEISMQQRKAYQEAQKKQPVVVPVSVNLPTPTAPAKP